mgnify:CR=1 FL=1
MDYFLIGIITISIVALIVLMIKKSMRATNSKVEEDFDKEIVELDTLEA